LPNEQSKALIRDLAVVDMEHLLQKLTVIALGVDEDMSCKDEQDRGQAQGQMQSNAIGAGRKQGLLVKNKGKRLYENIDC
jgi:hypothetical protein